MVFISGKKINTITKQKTFQYIQSFRQDKIWDTLYKENILSQKKKHLRSNN